MSRVCGNDECMTDVLVNERFCRKCGTPIREDNKGAKETETSPVAASSPAVSTEMEKPWYLRWLDALLLAGYFRPYLQESENEDVRESLLQIWTAEGVVGALVFSITIGPIMEAPDISTNFEMTQFRILMYFMATFSCCLTTVLSTVGVVLVNITPIAGMRAFSLNTIYLISFPFEGLTFGLGCCGYGIWATIELGCQDLKFILWLCRIMTVCTTATGAVFAIYFIFCADDAHRRLTATMRRKSQMDSNSDFEIDPAILFDKYKNGFQKNDYSNLDEVRSDISKGLLQKDDLREMGVTSVRDRIRMMDVFSK